MRRARSHWPAPLLPLLPPLFLALSLAGFWASGARAADSVTIGMQLEPPVLDPGANPAVSEALYGNVFEGLVQFAPDGSVLPKLAESWDMRPMDWPMFRLDARAHGSMN
jgi:ABC-type transport system substrate-binding protein